MLLRRGRGSYELEVMTRTGTNIFGEVLGPCAHCCPCEALEQKRPKKHKPERQEIKHSYLHHSICLDEHIICINIDGQINLKVN